MSRAKVILAGGHKSRTLPTADDLSKAFSFLAFIVLMGALFSIPEPVDQQLATKAKGGYEELLAAAIGGPYSAAANHAVRLAAARTLLADYNLKEHRWAVLETAFLSGMALGRTDVATPSLSELSARFGSDARRVLVLRAIHTAIANQNPSLAEDALRAAIAADPADLHVRLTLLSLLLAVAQFPHPTGPSSSTSSSVSVTSSSSSPASAALNLELVARDICALFPTDAAASRAVAIALLSLPSPRPTLAIESLETALAADVRDPFTLVALADALASQGKEMGDEKARLYYITAAELMLPGVDLALVAGVDGSAAASGARTAARAASGAGVSARMSYGAPLRRALLGILHVTKAITADGACVKPTDARNARLAEWAAGHLVGALPASPLREAIQKLC